MSAPSVHNSPYSALDDDLEIFLGKFWLCMIFIQEAVSKYSQA